MNTMSVANELSEAGERVTPQRIAVMEYMNSTFDHPSAEQVYKAVRQIHPRISFSTVYKTLKMLQSHGVVSEISMSTGARYDMRRTPHINLVCMQCNAIEDLEGDFVNAFFMRVSHESKYKLDSFEIRGLCGVCRN